MGEGALVAPTPLSVAFGQVLRELREAEGLSQEALSFRAERHRTFVSLIERGQSTPTMATLWLLADALGARPSQVLEMVEQRLASPTPPVS